MTDTNDRYRQCPTDDGAPDSQRVDNSEVHSSSKTRREHSKFSLGQLVITRGANDELDQVDVLKALGRHTSGDWGDLSATDKQANEDALEIGERILSAYHSLEGTKFWIITEWDRSATTVLLPSEY